MTVVLPEALQARMFAHAEADYPHECCGILVGRAADERRVIEDLVEAANVREDRRADRFELDPKTLLRVTRELRGTGQDVVGYYHSHPDHPAEPSATDLEFGALWPEHAFVIVEVRSRKSVRARSWVVPDGGDAFIEELIEVQ